MASTKPETEAYVTADGKVGLFTHGLIEGLSQGGAFASAAERAQKATATARSPPVSFLEKFGHVDKAKAARVT